MSYNSGFRYASTDAHKMDVQHYPVATGAAWLPGSLLTRNVSGQWEECGADPTAIGGVALDRVGAGSGPLAPIGRFEFPPLEARAVLAKPDTIFAAPYVGSPAIGNFGVVKGSDGVWRVDFTDTTNVCVFVFDIGPVNEVPNTAPGVTGIGLVKCKFLATDIQVN